MENELLPIAEVAKASGLTTRTLRYYDEIGLLTPTDVAPNGHRHYGQSDLLRLQQILVLRELDVSLDDIRAILEDQVSPISALRKHRDEVASKRAQLGDVLKTVDLTIDSLEADFALKASELFAGFNAEKQAQYERDLIERYGDSVVPHIDESKRRVMKMNQSEAAETAANFEVLEHKLAALIDSGAHPSDEQVQILIADHYDTVCKFWVPDAEQYAGLGQMYCDHPEFRSRKDAVHRQLAEFERDAMAIYAEESL